MFTLKEAHIKLIRADDVMKDRYVANVKGQSKRVGDWERGRQKGWKSLMVRLAVTVSVVHVLTVGS